MALDFFPQTGDPSPGGTYSALFALMSYPHVAEGFICTAGTGLDVDIAAGSALVGGGHITSDATETVTVTDNTQSFVGISLDRTGGEVVIPATPADLFTVAGSTEGWVDYLPLALVDASGGAVQEIQDMRWTSSTPTMTAAKPTDEQRIQVLPDPDMHLTLPLRRERLYQIRMVVGFTGHMDGGYLVAPPGATQNTFGVSFDQGGIDDLRTSPANENDRWDISSQRAFWQIEGTIEMGTTSGKLTLWWEGFDRNPCTFQAGSYLQATDITK